MRLRDVAARSDLGKFFNLMERQFTREEWALIKEGSLVRLNDQGAAQCLMIIMTYALTLT